MAVVGMAEIEGSEAADFADTADVVDVAVGPIVVHRQVVDVADKAERLEQALALALVVDAG